VKIPAATIPALLLALLGLNAISAETIALRLAEIHPTDHPTAKADYEFARLVRERSGGRVTIAVYPDSALGQELAVLEQVRFGAIDIARVSLSAVAGFVPRLNALQMPYLYRDADHMWRVLTGEVGRELLASVSSAGFVGLGWFEAGARSFYNSRRPIRNPSDLAGLRIRVQESRLNADIVSAFGAAAVPQAFGEVFSALETGAVDGAENNAPTYYTSSHYLIAPYYTLTEHARIPEIIVGSALGLASLSPADRELLMKAAMDSIDYQRAEWAKYDKLAMERIRAAGVVVTQIADLGPWRSLERPVYDRQSPEIRALVERIRALK
jgi:tripartite ATP-independent transporter DctP family solute receptor